jgi:hypothetical protein
LARTNIAVDEGVAIALSDEATRENKTLYALANEFLESSLKICKEGGYPSEIYPSWRFVKILKDIDSVPLPGSLVERMVKHLYSLDKNQIFRMWYDEGARIGAYLKIFSPMIEGLSEIVGEFQSFLPVKRIEFRKVEEIGAQYLIRAIGAGLSTESTSCAEQFIRGLASSYSLRVVSSKISEGIIEVNAVQDVVRK